MVLELADWPIIRHVGKMEDVTISMDSWEYHVDLLVLCTQSLFGGHPPILGRPWVAMSDAYIGRRSKTW